MLILWEYTTNNVVIAELKQNVTSHEQVVDQIFLKMDTDGNGTLSKDEFITGAKLDQSVIRALSLYPAMQ